MNLTITDNFLEPHIYTGIRNALMPDQPEFIERSVPWLYVQGVTSRPGGENINFDEKYNYQFVHLVYDALTPKSPLFDMLVPIISKFDPLAIVKIKANMQPNADKIIEYPMHVDKNDFYGRTGIYYINTNNGYTLFEDGTKINSVANRYIEFDSNTLHTGTTCTDQQVRCLINFNFFPFGGK